MRFWDGEENSWYIMAYCHKQFDFALNLIKSMQLLNLEQRAVGRIIRKIIQLSIGEYSAEDVGMHIFLVDWRLIFLNSI